MASFKLTLSWAFTHDSRTLQTPWQQSDVVFRVTLLILQGESLVGAHGKKVEEEEVVEEEVVTGGKKRNGGWIIIHCCVTIFNCCGELETSPLFFSSYHSCCHSHSWLHRPLIHSSPQTLCSSRHWYKMFLQLCRICKETKLSREPAIVTSWSVWHF